MLTKAQSFISDQTFTTCLKKSGISDKTVERAIKDEIDRNHNLDVEEVVMENVADDLDQLKTKFNIFCDITAEKLIHLHLGACITNIS